MRNLVEIIVRRMDEPNRISKQTDGRNERRNRRSSQVRARRKKKMQFNSGQRIRH